MLHTRKIVLPGNVILALMLLASFSIAAGLRHAGAGEGGEGSMTGNSLTEFSGVGYLDSLDENGSVINDCARKISPNVKFYKPGPKKISKSAFVEGSRVGYVEDGNGRIISLWLLPDEKKRK